MHAKALTELQHYTTLLTELQHYTTLLTQLTTRQITPGRIIGSGYTNARETALQYLAANIARLTNELEELN